MELTIKLTAVMLILVLAGIMIQKSDPQYASLLGMVGCAALLLSLAECIKPILSMLQTFWDATNQSDEIFSSILKVTVLSVFTRLSSEYCADAGQNALSSTIELCGNVVCTCISLPLIVSVWNLLQKIVGGVG